MAPTSIATAADYADAMGIARRAKNWLFLLLLLMLLIQIGVFFVAAFTGAVAPSTPIPAAATSVEATTLPAAAAAVVSGQRDENLLVQVLRYLTGLTGFLGTALSVVLSLVLLLIVNIMLIGRLIGVRRLTSALIWSFVLAVLLFPWQAFLDPYTFKIPGVLYTWEELTHPLGGATFVHGAAMDWHMLLLRWARFVGFPVLTVVLLMAIQVKSVRGMRQALGESMADPDDITPKIV